MDKPLYPFPCFPFFFIPPGYLTAGGNGGKLLSVIFPASKGILDVDCLNGPEARLFTIKDAKTFPGKSSRRLCLLRP